MFASASFPPALGLVEVIIFYGGIRATDGHYTVHGIFTAAGHAGRMPVEKIDSGGRRG